MATVTTTEVATAVLRPVQYLNPSAPFGELVFASSFIVPIKAAADENRIIIAATLPRNYVYRLQSLEIFCAADTDGVFFDWAAAWTVVLTENQVTTRRFGLFNQVSFNDALVKGVKIEPDSVSNDFGTWYVPGVQSPIGNQLIAAGPAASVMTLQMMDTSADTTAAVTVLYRLMATAYTIAQYNASAINTQDWVT